MPYEEVERLVRKEKLEDKYEVGAELGRGKFAIVKRVTEKASREQYAAKFLRKRRAGKACRDDIIVEVDIMRQSMNHHRIIKLLEVFESTREMIIIIELATGGELFRMIAVDPLPEDKARSVVLQLLEGVEHLHSLSIVHLDLKPENILLYRKGQLDIRIADFGLALQIAPGEQVKTLVGTAEYVAPEILNYEPLTIAADMWSIGALTYALLAGYSPFQGETHSHTFCNVSLCEYDFEDEVFDDISQEAKDFIEELLQKQPSDRLTATKCLNHPWIKNHSILPSQGLNSSTSSLDSALCMDSNNSSLDPSPSSSASSSFAPRPSGRTDEDEQQEDLKKQLTEKVSKLCISTEMQKDISTLRGSLVGSASSISSSDSNTTVKVDEEDGGDNGTMIFERDTTVSRESGTPLVSRSGTATPPSSPLLDTNRQKRSPSSSSVAEEDGRNLSRPSSSLRVTTPIDDLISLAPETMEKMRKLERLKRRRDEAQQGDSTFKQSREPLTRKLSSEPASHIIAPRNSERRTSSPATFRNQRVAQKLEVAVEEEEVAKEGDAKENVPAASNGVTELVKQTSEESCSNSPPPVEKVEKSSTENTSEIQKQDKVNLEDVLLPPLKEEKKVTVSDKEILLPKLEHNPSSSPSENAKIKCSRAKSESPTSSSKIQTSRSIKSCSPMSIEEVKRRSRTATTASNNSVRKSWRNTPHIDPDFIDAILRGEIDDNLLEDSKLETMTELSEPRSTSPLAGRTMGLMSQELMPPGQPVVPILKKTDSKLDRVTKSESPRRVVMVVSTSSRTGSIDLSSSPETLPHVMRSPLKSPGSYSQTDTSNLTKNHLSALQASMSLSRSTPDLSSILGSTKHSKRVPSREDSYVTDTSTRKNSISRSSTLRSNLLSGHSIVRSLTSAGRHGSKSQSKDRFKLK